MNTVAQKGFSLGATVYQSSRPSYPATAIGALFAFPPAAHGTQTPQTILEIGCGTGIFTRLLIGHFPPSRATRIVCIDPCPEMLALAKQSLKSPFLTFSESSVSDLAAFPPAHFDRIYIAQAFHWFANLNALRDMHRVLKPGGVLGMLWNIEDSGTPWVRNLREIYEEYEIGIPQYRLGHWKRVFEEPEVSDLFEMPFESVSVRHVQNCEGGLEGVWRRVLSKSYISVLDAETQKLVRDRVMRGLESWRVEFDGNGRVRYPYITDVFLTRKR